MFNKYFSVYLYQLIEPTNKYVYIIGNTATDI